MVFLWEFLSFTIFLSFGYNWGQIPMDGHMLIYKLCKNAKNCTHKWYFYGHFLSLYWPLVIFGVKFLYIVICSYINFVNMPKIVLINGISIGIFNF